MKIVIDNPCHENWDAMSPNEKGAFCLSCQKTVIDFSKKTVDEIKNFFVELPQTETVCGRFQEDQLDEISFEHFFKQFIGWKYFQKAAVIAFFIFGFGLFGHAQTGVKQKPLMMKGEVAYVIPPDSVKAKHKKDSIKLANEPKLDIMTMGGPRYIPDLSDHAVLDSDLKQKPKSKEHKELMGKPSVRKDRE